MKFIQTMKRMAATVGVLALCGMPGTLRAQDAQQNSATQGQEQAAPMRHGGKNQDELTKLNLSDDQKTQVKKIHQDMKAQMEAVQNDTALSADQKQAKMQQIHKASHRQVKQLLTPEQRQQMKADEMARKAARQQGSQTPQQQ
jgi:Spy/CpxP family protein refolding chaperone